MFIVEYLKSKFSLHFTIVGHILYFEKYNYGPFLVLLHTMNLLLLYGISLVATLSKMHLPYKLVRSYVVDEIQN